MTELKKKHTIVISDLHLSDAEPVHENNPLWKKFRRKEYFYDESFSSFLTTMQEETKEEGIELVLNGDIFDFDSVMSLPEKADYIINNYEKKCGLNPMEVKSIFKIEAIMKDHQLWTSALSKFIKNGNDVIFVIGNHDIELNWFGVQEKIIELLSLSDEERKHIRFCEWFYISEEDTLIEHGHQYDPYCMCLNTINPVIKKNGIFKMRLPFGNLANRFMINKMGLKNPHNDAAFVKTFLEFVHFFYKYEMRIQPFMIFTWFFGAIRTFIYSVGEGLLSSNRDPLTFHDRIETIAEKAKTSEKNVLVLKENHAHPAVRKPFSILRELWLDRAFFMVAVLWFSWQVFTTSAVFDSLSIWWFLVPVLSSIPFFIYYAHGISSDIHYNADLATKYAPISARLCKVKNIVLGHTHKNVHSELAEFNYINTGTWSTFYLDVECTIPVYRRNFAWINPREDRSMKLFAWEDSGSDIQLKLTKESQEFLASKEKENETS